MSVLCAASACSRHGYHKAGCVSEPYCVGCSPREAGDGIRLCWPHRDHVAQDASAAARLWFELIDWLVPQGSGMGEVVSFSRDPGLRLNFRVIAARASILDKLALWSKLIVDERNRSAPSESVIAMAEFIADNATWLAAHDLAGSCADELREAAWGAPWRLAHPDGTQVRDVGECPWCSGRLRAILRRADAIAPSEVRCSLNDQHRWYPHQWSALWPQADDLEERHVSTSEAATLLGVSEVSVRAFVSSGRLARLANGKFALGAVQRLRDELWTKQTA